MTSIYVVFEDSSTVRGVYRSKERAMKRAKRLCDAEAKKRKWGDCTPGFSVHSYKIDKDFNPDSFSRRRSKRDEPLARYHAPLKPGEFETCSESCGP